VRNEHYEEAEPMSGRRHQDDTATYRELPSYAARTKSFNALVGKCRKYFRVMAELDLRPDLTAADIAQARIETLEKEIAAIRREAGL
jgi:hypothetical protein